MSKNRFSRKFEKNINSVINFRRVTHFRLCLLETQVTQVDIKPGSICQVNKKDSIKKVDIQLEGGDGEGDDVGEIKEGKEGGVIFKSGGKQEQFKKEGVEGNLQTNVNVNNIYECKICGKLTKSNFENKTISLTHTVNMLLALQRNIVKQFSEMSTIA